MEYLKRFALWFVSGVAFAIGATLVISGSDHLKRQSTPNIKESNVALEKIAISEVEISGLTKHLTVTGNVTNNSEKSLRDARILIQLVRGEKVLFECDDSLSNYPEPGKTLRFQADCHAVERANIPADSTVRVKVWFAQSW
jgi:hypothetical protein